MKRIGALIFISSIMLFGAMFSSCLDEEVKAKESVVGSWKVISIKSYYGQFSARGGSYGLNVISQAGDFGFFNFDDKGHADYKFVRNDTTYQNTAEWSLHSRNERVSGFRVIKYSLNISGDFEFDAAFGNGAKRSEVHARQLELTQWPNKSGYGVGIVMELEKQ